MTTSVAGARYVIDTRTSQFTVQGENILVRRAERKVTAENQGRDVYRVNVGGRPTLHGVTQNHSFFAKVAFGGDSFRAYGG